MKKVLALSLILSTFSAAVSRADVIGEEGGKVIVTIKEEHGKKYAKFELCTTYGKNECTLKAPLGEGKYYSLDALASQKSIEGWQALGAGAADAAIFFGSIYIAVRIGAGSGDNGGGDWGRGIGRALGGVFGFFIGAGSGVAIPKIVKSFGTDAINAGEQYRQWRSVRAEITQGNKDIFYSGNILDYTKSLQVVLDSMLKSYEFENGILDADPVSAK